MFQKKIPQLSVVVLRSTRAESTFSKNQSTRQSSESTTTSGKGKFKKLVIMGGNTTSEGFGRRQQSEKTEYYSPQLPADWSKVWPSVHSCSNIVPLPIRQGHIKNMDENSGLIPNKFGNLELMKIPNFLHLTPPHIAKHCAALKPFLTKWPSGLKTESDIRQHYPVEVITRDFVQSSPNIRDERARLVTMRVPLKLLNLNLRARDKLKALAGKDRIIKESGEEVLLLTSERCPTRKQNLDFLRYVITALTSESKKVHDWEAEQSEEDWNVFRWHGSSSEKAVEDFLKDHPNPEESLTRYQAAVSELKNEGEELKRLEEYKKSTKQLLGLETLESGS